MNMDSFGAGVVFKLQPLRSIHLNSDFMFEAEPNGNARSVYALIAISIFLVIIAWINYINLSSARSLERAREVGMRKVNRRPEKTVTGSVFIGIFSPEYHSHRACDLLVMLLGSAFQSSNRQSWTIPLDPIQASGAWS